MNRVENVRGRITKMNREKGFGFIRPESGNTSDHFFHTSGVTANRFADLNEGDVVEFTSILGGEKGPRAQDVSRVG